MRDFMECLIGIDGIFPWDFMGFNEMLVIQWDMFGMS